MKILRPLLLGVLMLGAVFCSIQIYSLEQKSKVLKEDLVELSKIKYGLFSIDEWKRIIAGIVSKKIEELNFTDQEKTQVREKVQSFLEKTITELENRFYEEKSKSIFGWIQGGVASLTGIFEKIKKDVPVFTDQILSFLNDPDNRQKVKAYINEKLADYADKTFGKIDYAEHDRILSLYGYGDREQTISGLTSELDTLQDRSRPYIIAIYLLTFISALLLVFTVSPSKHEYFWFTMLCVLLLACGLLLPMIEIDARIDEMSFTLLGEQVTFHDQVLYYRSKSILEVVQVMLQQEKWDVLMVGLLVLLFSVIFPAAKLICSLISIYRPAVLQNSFMRFMVMRTGKWSMADVMVVAIFMSYIGFSGILTEQLNQLEGLTKSIDILTTNKSSLQMGFFLFTGFAVMSLLLSQKIGAASEVNREL